MQRIAVLLASILVSCSSGGSNDQPPPSNEPTDAGAPAPPPATSDVTWSACPLHSENGSGQAECTTVMTPLDRRDPAGKTIPFFVKRYRAPGGRGRIALWMLQGGPGGSGYVFENFAEAMATKFPDVDYYMPDHRGTGRSEKLTCLAQDPSSSGGLAITPEEWPACLAEARAKWGADLAKFDTSNAANDVGLLATNVRAPGQTLAVYGVSYGTYWALRLMQLFPSGFDRVVLDSFVPPGSSLARQDQDANEAAHDLLRACGKDAACSAKLGSDPAALADALVTKVKSGHCSALVVPPAAQGFSLHAAFRLALGTLVEQFPYRAAFFEVIHRLDRCGADDVVALQHFLDTVYAQPPAGTPDPFLEGFGFVLSNNIAFSELWESPSPSAADLAAIRDAAVASREITVDMAQEHDIWPLYPPDEFVGKWPDASHTPVLVLAGGFDPATLLRKQLVAKDHLTGPGRHFVVVPSATHGVITSSTTTDNRSCGTKMMMSFFEDATAPDTKCLADIVPTSFVPEPSLNKALFGVPTWE
jgi:pimeloyl-ACP methyl ester carboxylesterase